MAGFDDERKFGRLGVPLSCLNWILSVSIGHGYRLRRAIAMGILAIVFGACVFLFAHGTGQLTLCL